MKVLWVCNMTPSVILEALGKKDRGGLWVDHMISDLRRQEHMLYILFPGDGAGGEVDAKLAYCSFQTGAPHVYRPELKDLFCRQLEEVCPDVIHIWGTEYPHTLAMVEAARETGMTSKVLISIQGLCGVYAGHYTEGIPASVCRAYTFRDLLTRNNILDQQKLYIRRGRYEKEALEKVEHVVGRTEWDLACTRMLSPDAEYHYCGETLRAPFYEGAWDYGSCTRYRIFASSCVYPVKGFHYLLEAFREVLKSYSDATLVVPGNDFVHLDTLEKKLRESSYHRYMRKYILSHGMEDKITFLGRLGPEEMKRQFLQANVFVLPSTVENSPNSLGEAMILGTPCVASDVGGVTSMMTHEKEGFIYQSTASYMLAHYIKEVFAMGDKAEAMGKAAAKHARITHDPQKNLEDLLAIYETVVK